MIWEDVRACATPLAAYWNKFSFFWGDASVQTTERCFKCKRDLSKFREGETLRGRNSLGQNECPDSPRFFA
jgi:hypothetical protein